MRFDFCLTTLQGLAPDSAAPTGEFPYRGIRAAGYGGVQAPSMAGVAEAGLVGTGLAMIAQPQDVDAVARMHAGEGFSCTTLIVGNGLEGDAEVDRFCAAILEAQQRHGYRLLLENHRASMTQDIRRTIDMIGRFPALRFTGDFSHWYVGHEFAMGDFGAKLDFIQPLIDRVAIVEGRIGSTNCAQLTLDGVDDPRHFVAHHRAFWTRCFLACMARGEEPVFAPQLLPAVIHAHGMDFPIDYAQRIRSADGRWHEQDDRWQQSLLLCAIARECEQSARAILDLRASDG
jgi:hypothetical protein